jgi:hypothetical protein
MKYSESFEYVELSEHLRKVLDEFEWNPNIREADKPVLIGVACLHAAKDIFCYENGVEMSDREFLRCFAELIEDDE